MTDFDRGFSPRRREVSERMHRVAEAFPDGAFPPIVVYELGARTSSWTDTTVSRSRGGRALSRSTPRSPSFAPTGRCRPTPTERSSSHVERWFEEASGLEEARPAVRIKLSRTADYIQLLENVQIHGYHLMMGRGRALPPAEIAADWYERVYAPVVDGLRRMGGTLPDLTDGDLFLELYRRRRDRYAEQGCPTLSEIVAEVRAEPARPWWAPWRRRGTP